MRAWYRSILLLGAVACVGCHTETAQSTGQGNAAPQSSPYLTSQPASNPISLTEAMESCQVNGETESTARQLTLIGKIDAGEFAAFETERLAFMLSELPEDGHGVDDPDHEDNCPFCKRRAAKAPKAIVEIVDEQGNTVPGDARERLGLSEGDRIVAQGEATYDSSVNMLTIRCQQVATISQ